MTNTSFIAKIRGLPDQPSITEINARSGPGTNFDRPFKVVVGLKNLVVLDVQQDSEAKHLNGKAYQWFRLAFPDHLVGWVRDDLLVIEGNGTAWGYGQVPPETFAFALTRKLEQTGGSTTGKFPASSDTSISVVSSGNNQIVAPPPQPDQNISRVMQAAFAITAAFEGEGYAAYNNYDSGIISYGVIQFTLASGSLFTVLEKYLLKSTSSTAAELRTYIDRLKAGDEALRHDENLKRILKAAAEEPEMRDAQNALMITNYWDRIINNYVHPRQYQYPLTYALLFDIGVNFGVGDGFVRMAEKEFGIPSGSNPITSGVSESQIIRRVAELRKISHDKQAARENLPGLRVRGDFWLDRTIKGDWNLRGDSDGTVLINGRKVLTASST